MSQPVIAVIGLGYVGLPLAVRFASKYRVLGYDHAASRLADLRAGVDKTGSVAASELATTTLEYVGETERLVEADVLVVTVPTPVDAGHCPDLSALESATAMLAQHLKPGATVVYESTVYPGLTEEVCVPIIERVSGKRWREDFFVGYSPERVNPGDTQHTVENVVKVVAGDTPETLELLATLYGSVIPAGVHRAESIRVAEAAKVIENTQRDLNIALMNELSVLFHKLDLDTEAVLRAARTKWNFLPFEPGLVGGHCIGVDPYYLTHKAHAVGHQPDVILAGRKINDSMGEYVARETLALLQVANPSVLVLGWTFKENVTDARNTRVIELVRTLREAGASVDMHDPCADAEVVSREYGETLLTDYPKEARYDAIILAVRHQVYRDTLTPQLLRTWCRGEAPVLVDVKGLFSREETEAAGLRNWRL